MKYTIYKTAIVIFCYFAGFSGILAQTSASPKLIFEADSAYLGRLKMADSPITQRFDFKVLPGQYVTIKEVKPDCACSIATYPTAPLEGGEFGYIMVTFTPYKLGPFEKRFAVIFEDEAGGQEVNPTELVIKGYIEPEKVDLALDFPHKCGNIRMRNKLVSFGGIGNSTLVKQRIQFYNDSDYPITFGDSISLPSYIELVLDTPRVIPPRAICEALVFYHPELKNDFGYSYDHIRLFSDDPAQEVLELDIAAIIRPETQVKTNDSPLLWVTPTMDLGTVPVAKDFIVSFMIYNRGKGDLIVHKAEAKSDIMVLGLDKETIKQGDFCLLKVQVTNLSGSGKYERSVTIHTNDPTQPTKELKVVATVL